MGILALLNEECLRPKGSDSSFCAKLHTMHADNPRVEKNKLKQEVFTVRHFAATVSYDSRGFVEKNKDAIGADIIEALSASEDKLLASLFADGGADDSSSGAVRAAGDDSAVAAGAGGRRRRRSGAIMAATLGMQFRQQLSELMGTIDATSVHYIRCIKPNKNKSATEYDPQMVVEQLRCAGVVEAIRISRAAFPTRMARDEFVTRYCALTDDDRLRHRAADAGALAENLLGPSPSCAQEAVERAGEDTAAPPPPLLYFVGKTKLFFSAGISEQLEVRRAVAIAARATRLQAQWRGVSRRRQYAVSRRAATRLQATARGAAARNRFRETLPARTLVAGAGAWRGRAEAGGGPAPAVHSHASAGAVAGGERNRRTDGCAPPRLC